MALQVIGWHWFMVWFVEGIPGRKPPLLCAGIIDLKTFLSTLDLGIQNSVSLSQD